jgi:hypothetical protein
MILRDFALILYEFEVGDIRTATPFFGFVADFKQQDTQNEKVQWQIYNVIREVESTFRVLKTDLDLRPIYHKTDQYTMAHLHLGILAYTLINTLRHQLKKNGYNAQWKEVVKVMNTHKAVSTSIQNLQKKLRAFMIF